MSSTLLLGAAPTAASSGTALLHAVLLPAATCAPGGLALAVDAPVWQETTVRVQDIAGSNASGTSYAAAVRAAAGSASAVAHAAPVAVVPAAFRTRKHMQGPPSRGRPV